MGIIEKAIDRAREEPAAASAAPPRESAGSAAPARKIVARVVDDLRLPVAAAPVVAVRSVLDLEKFPALARDFRFLKRPVLARVFGISRSTSKAGNLVVVTSDLPQAGKSFVSLNLGASMATEQMTRVLLVDADPVRRTLSTRLGLEARPGLLELLAGEQRDLGEVILPTDMESLFVLPAGQPRPDATELLGGPRMAEVLRSFDDPNLVVLLDSPPLLVSSEGRVLSDLAHHALVVVEAGRSVAGDVAAVLDLLKGTTASVSLVLNKTPVQTLRHNKDYYYPY